MTSELSCSAFGKNNPTQHHIYILPFLTHCVLQQVLSLSSSTHSLFSSFLKKPVSHWIDKQQKMEASIVSKFLKVCIFTLLMVVQLVICKVTYDKKAIVINGERRILLSGSIHYPRSTPEVLLLSLPTHSWFYFC